VSGAPPTGTGGAPVNQTWTLEQAAAYLKIHDDTCAALARAGDLPACKVGRRWIFMPHLLAEYVEKKSRDGLSIQARPSVRVPRTLAEKMLARRAQKLKAVKL
jgi:excisionase family DNA binding protein